MKELLLPWKRQESSFKIRCFNKRLQTKGGNMPNIKTIKGKLQIKGRIELGMSKGYNSYIHCLLSADGQGKPESVYKVIGALKGGFQIEIARCLAKDILCYYPLLRGGIAVSNIDEVILLEERDEAEIVIKSPFKGADCESLIRKTDDNDEIKQLVKRMLDLLAPLLNKRCENDNAPIGLGLNTGGFECVMNRMICSHQVFVGIDSKTANFCQSNGELCFVDFFPPRYRKTDSVIVEIPEPKTQLGYRLGYWKHFTVCGILHVFFSQLCRIRPDLREEFENIILGYFSVFPCVKSYFENSCWKKVRDLLNKENYPAVIEIIDSMFGADIYQMREIAAELAYAKLMSKEDFEYFYRKSHFEDTLPEKQIAALKFLLIFALPRETENVRPTLRRLLDILLS